MLSSNPCKRLKTRAQELLNIAGIIETSQELSKGQELRKVLQKMRNIFLIPTNFT